MNNFKIFHKYRKRWIDTEDIVYYAGSFYEEYRDFEDGVDLEPKQIVVLWGTGEKDKDGNPIYQGDICIQEGGLEDYWYVVEWVYAGWQLVTYKKPNANVRGISDGLNQGYLEPDVACNLEIVGNICDNPELLEVV